MTTEDAGEPLPISSLEHHRYCPRQCALILVDGVWTDNVHTVRGQRGHRRADAPAVRRERGRVVARAVPLWSARYGLTGRADAIEVDDRGEVVPVEYKMGTRHGDTADVQLCAQALCLEEMLDCRVERGAVWYAGWRRRHPVVFDDALREATVEVIERVRGLASAHQLPSAVDDARCQECQLIWHCLPWLVASPGSVDAYVEEEVWRCGN